MTNQATTTPPSKTILIVDDEPAVREVLTGYFEHQYGPRGYRVETAADGVEALIAVRRRRPALILLDIEMPGMDGVQALRGQCAGGLHGGCASSDFRWRSKARPR